MFKKNIYLLLQDPAVIWYSEVGSILHDFFLLPEHGLKWVFL